MTITVSIQFARKFNEALRDAGMLNELEQIATDTYEFSPDNGGEHDEDEIDEMIDDLKELAQTYEIPENEIEFI